MLRSRRFVLGGGVEMGTFCDICQAFENVCYWRCGRCNDGEWGFCNRCVNRGRCCTHPLLPISSVNAHRGRASDGTMVEISSKTTGAYVSGPKITIYGDENNTDEAGPTYRALALTTKCNICGDLIDTSTTRFHCLECAGGNYDICTNCYLRLGASGRISKENGRAGWRRCLAGHRMMVVGFDELHVDGPHRVVVRELVGGRALKEDYVSSNVDSGPISGSRDWWSWAETDAPGHNRRKQARHHLPTALRDSSSSSSSGSNIGVSTSNNDGHSSNSGSINGNGTVNSNNNNASSPFPPSGGVGLRLLALYSYYPEDGVTDELFFPRGAEITEAEDINGDWLWGIYAGAAGLFPGGGYVQVLADES